MGVLLFSCGTFPIFSGHDRSNRNLSGGLGELNTMESLIHFVKCFEKNGYTMCSIYKASKLVLVMINKTVSYNRKVISIINPILK